MPAVIAAGVAADPGKPMVTDPASSLSYRELDKSSRRLAAALVADGVGKGSRVGLLAPNGVDWVRVAVAVTRIGAVLVPLSTLLRPGELRMALLYHARCADMFKVNGATVYPSEVEAALRGLPGVTGVHVTNAPVDQQNRVGAAVLAADLDIAALHAAARERLSAFKVPASGCCLVTARCPAAQPASSTSRPCATCSTSEAWPRDATDRRLVVPKL